MDNLTHSLVGATLAELALPAGAPRAMRRTFFIAGVVAANLPDADLVYTRITPAPLGSLLHHRGHTHTVAGLALLGLAMVAICLLPSIRDTIRPVRGRLWALIAVALASHLVLDSWNSYGVHPFWPLDSRWFYGDAVYILEPWLWMLLGVVAVLNTTSRGGRAFLGAAIVGLIAFGTYLQVIPVVATTALVAVALALAVVLKRRSPRARAAISLALSAAFVAALFATREVARGEALATLEPAARARVVDVVLSPEAANPLCWNVLTLVRDQPGTSYVMTHGDVAVLTPVGLRPRTHAQRRVGCAAHTVARRAARPVPRGLLGARLDAVRPSAGSRGRRDHRSSLRQFVPPQLHHDDAPATRRSGTLPGESHGVASAARRSARRRLRARESGASVSPLAPGITQRRPRRA